MTTEQKRKALQRLADAEREVAQLKEIRVKILRSGYSSATMSVGGGSKSYSRLDVARITETIAALNKEIKALRAMLSPSEGGGAPWKRVIAVYS